MRLVACLLLCAAAASVVNGGGSFGLPDKYQTSYWANGPYASLPYGNWIDVNGDGLVDFVKAYQDSSGHILCELFLNTGCSLQSVSCGKSSVVKYCESHLAMRAAETHPSAVLFRVPSAGGLAVAVTVPPPHTAPVMELTLARGTRVLEDMAREALLRVGAHSAAATEELSRASGFRLWSPDRKCEITSLDQLYPVAGAKSDAQHPTAPIPELHIVSAQELSAKTSSPFLLPSQETYACKSECRAGTPIGSLPYPITAPSMPGKRHHCFFVDVNGDNLPDYVCSVYDDDDNTGDMTDCVYMNNGERLLCPPAPQ